MAQSEQYLLGHSLAEQERLRQQSQQLADEARWLLDQLDIPPGARVIDLGCGPQGILDLLSERVGPDGTVVGLERNERVLQQARTFVADNHLTNVEVLQGDAKVTRLPRGSFDLVHARLVLVNVPEPEQIVAEMVALARPGGVVALHEADYAPHLCEPPLPAWDRLFQVYENYSRMNGIDLFVGRRVPGMLRAAGLVDVQTNPVIHLYPHGHPRRMIFPQFVENVRDRLLAQGLLPEEELAGLMATLRNHLEDPHTLVVSHLFFQVWGHKPIQS
jgi:ubiquinone/menaquinone biosynthesis C-methylase UbiE